MEVARLMDILYKSHYLDKKDFYVHTFLRGMVAGAGGVLGATLLIGVLLWILSLFDTTPFIGPLIKNTRQTIEQR